MAFLAPNARWQGRGPTGEPIAFGKLYTYQANSVIPKATWKNHEQTILNENPIILDGKGEANIYWGDDEYYYIALYTADDQEVYDQDDYPYLVNPNVLPPSFDTAKKNNIVRNPQFTFWSNGETLTNINTSANTFDFIADDWLFRKTDTTSTINAAKVSLPLTDAQLPGDAPDVFSISCVNVGSATETQLEPYQRYESVRTFAAASVALTFSAKVVGAVSATISAHAYQNFGTGGSPSAEVDNSFGTFNLTQAMQQFSSVITLANLTGKTQGDNEDDALLLAFKLPANVVFEIQFGTVQLIQSASVESFDYLSQNDQFLRLYRNKTAFFNTGDYKTTVRASDDGWVNCDNGMIGSLSSGASHAGMYTRALYNILWNSVLNIYCPIFDSAGVPSTRGVDADTDFNANKRLALTKNLGRALAGWNPSGIALLQKGFTGDSGNNALQLDDNASFYTGTAVVFANIGGALPTTSPQINNSSTYYVIHSASNRIQLATTLAHAITGTPNITVSSAGTGRNIVGIAGATLLMGQPLGEATHAQIENEMSSHSHTLTFDPNTATSVLLNQAMAGGSLGGGGDVNATGGIIVNPSPVDTSQVKFNLIQPTLFVNVMLKL